MEILHSFLQRGNHWNTKALALRHMGWECPARLLDHQGCRNPHTNLSGMLEPEQVVAVPASPKVQILWSFWASITSWVYSWEQDEVVSLLSYGEIGYLETVRVSVCLFDSRQPSSIFFFLIYFLSTLHMFWGWTGTWDSASIPCSAVSESIRCCSKPRVQT